MNKLKKPEILSPAGNMESLFAAVEAGCDAVYIGGKNFSARKSAANFDDTELKSAIDYCRLRDVCVYVTVNTLYKDSELKAAANFAEKAVCLGVSAFIVQDLGFAGFLKSAFPNIPLHASTQMTVHDLEGALFLKEKGFSRIVLSRELSLEHIKKIENNCQTDLEVFVHGALCVSFSGQCLMSSIIGGRSGNRGACAQPCRLKYGLYNGDDLLEKGCLLSPKDLMTFNTIKDVCTSGVSSLKIEGRMKSPEYVYAVTKAYRDAVDSINDKMYVPSEETIKEVTQVFNRGGSFTTGYFNNHSGSHMMSTKTPKSTGTYIGKVRYHNPKTGRCTIEITQDLYPGDGIEIWTKTEPHTGTNINKEYTSPTVIELKIDGYIEKGDMVYKSFDKKIMDSLKGRLTRNTRKMEIDCNIKAIKGQKLFIEVKKGDVTVEEYGDIVEKAQNQPVTLQKFLSQIGKTGDTPFKLKFKDVEISDDIYMPISVINKARRIVLEKFEEKYMGSYKKNMGHVCFSNGYIEKNDVETPLSICISVTKNEQIEGALLPGIARVYVEADSLFLENIQYYVAKAKENNVKLFAALPRICLDGEYSKSLIKRLEKSQIDGYLIRTLGQIFSTNKEVVADYTFNIMNGMSLSELSKVADVVTVSQELNLKELRHICENDIVQKEIIIHGRQTLMTTNQCPIGNFVADKKCGKYCTAKNNATGYYLKDRKNIIFPIMTDCNICCAFILNSQKLFTLNKSEEIKVLKNTSFRLVFTDESSNEIKMVATAYMEQLAAKTINYKTEEIVQKYVNEGITNGHFFRGVL